MEFRQTCVQCGADFTGSHRARRYCSQRCKAQWRRANPPVGTPGAHECRVCGQSFPIAPDQGNKWLCSPACRRASNAKSVREFHTRRPEMEVIYRSRTRAKQLPDCMLVRFYRLNPNAPRSCQACGEARVVEVAHRPEHARLGERRSAANMKWPAMVWVLCPTCHRLIDRMNYPPGDIGLT